MTLRRLSVLVQENFSEMCMCALCHERIPDNVKPYTFPSTAPAALTSAALTVPHLGSGSSDEAYSYSSSEPNKAKAFFFCHTCWVWIHNLSICWTCGETVAREEEKVSYGWCWWHWACVSCLICRVGDFFFFCFLLYIFLKKKKKTQR